VVNGCEFMEEGKHAITLEKGVKAGTVFGCTLRGRDTITHEPGPEVQIGPNTNA